MVAFRDLSIIVEAMQKTMKSSTDSQGHAIDGSRRQSGQLQALGLAIIATAVSARVDGFSSNFHCCYDAAVIGWQQVDDVTARKSLLTLGFPLIESSRNTRHRTAVDIRGCWCGSFGRCYYQVHKLWCSLQHGLVHPTYQAYQLTTVTTPSPQTPILL